MPKIFIPNGLHLKKYALRRIGKIFAKLAEIIRITRIINRYASKQHRQRAETIVHTELSRAYNQGAFDGVRAAQRAGLMNVGEMIWSTAGTNRVCGRCLSLKDSVVGRTSDSGVTLPPLHPRCRCTIHYRESSKPAKPQVVDETAIRAVLDLSAFVFDAAHTQGDRHPHDVTEAEARRSLDLTWELFARHLKPTNTTTTSSSYWRRSTMQQDDAFCPLVSRQIDDLTCQDVSLAAEEMQPARFAPEEFRVSADWKEICAKCPNHPD